MQTPALFAAFDVCEAVPLRPHTPLIQHSKPTQPVASSSPVLMTLNQRTPLAAAQPRQDFLMQIPLGKQNTQKEDISTQTNTLWNTPPRHTKVKAAPLWRSTGTPGGIIPFSIRAPLPRQACPNNTYYTRWTSSEAPYTETEPNANDVDDDADGASNGLKVDLTTLNPVADSGRRINTGCAPVTDCTVGSTYEIIPPGAATDRVCHPVSTCLRPVEYESAPPTYTTDRTCSPVLLALSSRHHVTVGSTATTDNIFRAIVTHCVDGKYLNTSANANANAGETIDGEQCPDCPAGTTAYNPNCANAAASSLHTPNLFDPADCPSFHLYHTQPSCGAVPDDYPCGTGLYYNATASKGHPSRNCFACKECQATYVQTQCTSTTNTVCGSGVGSSALGSTASLQQCPFNEFRDDSNSGALGICRPCAVCPESLVMEACTTNHDTICGTYSTKSYVVEVVFLTLFIFAVWMTVFRVAVPIRAAVTIARAENTQARFSSPIRDGWVKID